MAGIAPYAPEPLLEDRDEPRVLDELLAERVGQALAREVVVGRTEAAGGEHDG